MTTFTAGSNVGSIQVNTAQSATTNTSTTVQSVTNVSSTTNVSTSAVANTITLAESAIMFMRAKTVTFTAQGLKPNTQYYPFFNGVSVASYCSTVSGSQSSTLITNEIGDLIGNFYLPANSFMCGSTKFLLVDNVRQVENIQIPDPIYGQAEAFYEANGTLKQQQTQVTVNSVVNTNNVVSTVNTVNTQTSTNYTTQTNIEIQLPPPVICESWFFEYAVYSPGALVYTITTNSATPPAATATSPVSGAGVISSTKQYISTSAGDSNTWFHTYAARTGVGGAQAPVKIYRQEWIGATTDLRPSLSNYRPTGISTGDTVVVTTPWTKVRAVACPVASGGLGAASLLSTTTTQPYDPLAQSFYVDGAVYPEGIFVTSLALYFKTVDQSTPVIVELRNMSNGTPGSNIFPGGAALIPGANASQSPDASVATVFRFDFPVHLSPNNEYCFVVRSSSLGYNLWTSKMGEIDVRTGKVIDQQPFLGTMFLSENNFTWVPDPLQDIKFDMNVALFDTSKTGNVIFRPQRDAVTNNYYGTGVNLPLSFMYTTKGSKDITVRIPMHGLKSSDKIFIEGIATPTPSNAFNNIVASSLNGLFTVTVTDEDNVVITTTGANTASKSGFLNVTNQFNMINNMPPTEVPDYALIQAVPVINFDNFSPTVLPNVTAVVAPTAPAMTSTNSFMVYANVQVNEAMLDYMATEFPGVSTLTEKLSLATAKSNDGTETPYTFKDFETLSNIKVYQTYNEPRLLASPANEAQNSGALTGKKSAAANIVLTSSNRYVSPVVDTNSMAMTIRSYKIDNQNGELDTQITAGSFVVGKTYLIHSIGSTNFVAIGAVSNTPGITFTATGVGSGTGKAYLNSEVDSGKGLALAKYKTIIRTLSQFSRKIQLFVTANSPAPAKIDAYVRTSTDRETHIDRDWQWMPIKGTYASAFVHSPSRLTTNEWMYELTVPENFNVYDIKLVMRSTNNSVIPKIYGIRTITDIQ